MKKYISFILLLICFVFITGCDGISTTKEDEVIDGITFKAEYENENENHYYLEIDKNNPFKYITSENFDEVFNGTNVVFIGYPTSDVSRAVVSLIISESNNFDIGTIYYFDAKSNGPEYEVKDNKIKRAKESNDLYKKMTEILKENLNKKITIDNKEYTTEDEIIHAPVVIFIKDGKIISYYNNFGKKDEEEFLGFGDDKLNSIKKDLYSLIEKYEE